MDNCFRFLVNVDQCFNMYIYDMFFYKLHNKDKIKINHVQSSASCGENSLNYAVSDIRMYLNKFPYHVKEYQFVFAMRKAWRQEETWENSLLYRLVQISYELRNENICMDVSGRTDRALNLIMLYETDMPHQEEAVDDYLSSERLKKDIELFFSSMGINCSKTCLAAIEEAFNEKQSQMKETTQYLIRSFIAEQNKIREHVQDNASCDLNIIAAFSNFLGQLLSNYQVFEIFVQRDLQDDPRGNTEALLRIVEYINSSFEYDGGSGAKLSLSQRCVKNWKGVVSEKEIERKYATMLFEFREKLNNLALTLETTDAPVPSSSEMPSPPKESDEIIKDEEEKFAFFNVGNEQEGEERKEEKDELKKVLNDFLENSLSVEKAAEGWKKAYGDIKNLIKNLEFSLEEFAGRLSQQYSQRVEQRKKEMMSLEKEIFFAGKKEKEEKLELKRKKDFYLDELKRPQMNPSLRFQDQLNLAKIIEEKNSEICKYIKCLSFVKFGRFMSLVLFVVICLTVHYTALQPFVFNDGKSLLMYASYILVTFFMAGLFWIIPRQVFLKKIKRCVEEISEGTEKYMTSYKLKAKNFNAYINALNLLDCYTTYYNLYDQADEKSAMLSQERLWHKIAVKDLLSKVDSFDGLIKYCCDCVSGGVKKINIGTLFSLDENNAKEPSDYNIYWPQG